MKHHIAKQLNEVAATTPTVFEWHLQPTEVEGSWLQHSAIAEVQEIDPEQNYMIDYILRQLKTFR